jgi:hypothetical protein
MCIIHQRKENTSKVGCCYRTKEHESEPKQTTFFPMGPPIMYLTMMNDYEIPMSKSLQKILWGWACVELWNKWEELIQRTGQKL